MKHKKRVTIGMAILMICMQFLVFLPTNSVVAASRATDISGNYTFTQVSIGGGGYVTGLVVHPNDSSVVYARTDVGGAYKWNESTGKWTQLMDINRLPANFMGSGSGQPGVEETQAYCVDSIGLDPNNKDVVFVACGSAPDSRNGYVFKSTNGGKSFVMTNLKVGHDGNGDIRQHGERFAVDPNNSNIVFFGSRLSGLWKSTNGGMDWQRVYSNLPDGSSKVGINQLLFDSDSRLYASSYGSGIYVSDNYGASWTRIKYISETTTSAEISQNVLYFTVPGDGAYKYSPYGGLTNISPNNDAYKITVDKKNNQLVYLVCGGGFNNFYRSTNGGTSWDYLNANSGANKDAFKAESNEARWKINSTVRDWLSLGAVVLDPNNTQRIWFAEGMGVWRCDNASQWNNNPVFYDKSSGIEEMVATDIQANANGGIVATTWDRIGFYIPDINQKPSTQLAVSDQFATGTSVEAAADDFNFLTLSVADHRFMGDGNHSGYSTDGGKTWTRFGSINGMTNNPSELKFGEVIASTGNHANMVWTPRWNGAKIYYSNNYGQTWKESSYPSFNNASHGFYLTSMKALIADGASPNTFYMYSWDPTKILKTTNGGASWNYTSSNGLPGWLWHPKFKNAPGYAGHIWLATGFETGGSDAGLYRSTDGGENFTKLSGFSQAWAVATGKAQYANGYPTLFVYGMYQGQWGLYRSTDEGQSWVLCSDHPLGLFDNVTCLEGDKVEFGKVYIGYTGNSFACGYVTGNGTTPTPDPDPTPDPIPDQNPTGTTLDGDGLTATIWQGLNYEQWKLSRVDETIDFNWGNGSPDKSVGNDNFMVRWSGYIKTDKTGEYTFYASTDDGCSLTSDNDTIINAWYDKAPTEVTGTKTLKAGVLYPITLNYYEKGGGAEAHLSWSSANVPKQIIPKQSLYTTYRESAPTVVNLLSNGSFSKGLDSWNTEQNSFDLYTGDSSDGDGKCIKAHSFGNGYADWKKTEKSVSGLKTKKTYVLSYKHKGDASGIVSVVDWAQGHNSWGNETAKLTHNQTGSDGNWKTYELTFTTSSATPNLSIYIINDIGPNNNVYFDDFVLYEK